MSNANGGFVSVLLTHLFSFYSTLSIVLYGAVEHWMSGALVSLGDMILYDDLLLLCSILYYFRVIWRCINVWPWNLGYGHSTLLQMTRFDRSSSYWSSIVTTVIFCIVFEIEMGYWSKNADFSHFFTFNLRDNVETLRIAFQNLTQAARVPRTLYSVKTLPKNSTLWVGCTNATLQTDEFVTT